MKKQNVKLAKDHTQVCVWRGTSLREVTPEKIKDFENFFMEEFNTRVKFLEEISTFPSKDKEGVEIPDTGGRPDVFFSVHPDDIKSFSMSRLKLRIRWIEDAIGSWNNKGGYILYPERVRGYCSWGQEDSYNPENIIDPALN